MLQTTKWGILLRDPHNIINRLPSPYVKEFIKHFKRVHGIKILDLGCGRGRHAVYLAKKGFEIFAVDASPAALEITKKQAQKHRVKVKTYKADMSSLPFKDCFFDGVVSINVIHHNILPDIERTVLELKRVLKSNGILLMTLLSKKDFRFGLGKKLGPCTFILKNDPEEGIIHSFFTRKMVKRLLNQFTIKTIFEERDTVRNGKISFRWIIEAVKL